MLSMMLMFSLGIGAVFAMSAMIATWQQYAGAWAALDAEQSANHRGLVRYATCVIDDRRCVRVPAADFRTKPREICAAA